MERGSVREVLLKSLESSEPAEFAELVGRANLQLAAARRELEQMASERLSSRWATTVSGRACVCTQPQVGRRWP